MKINLFRLFRKQNNLKLASPEDLFNVLSTAIASYPLFISLEESDVYAYSTRFMIKSIDLSVVEQIITRYFHQKPNKQKECLFNNGKTLHYFKFIEFNQIVIDIITNDTDFIESLCKEKFSPPAHDIVFPDRDFETVGSLQGDVALWWDIYWLPFWNALDKTEKDNYMERNKISDQLKEFLALHK